MANPVGKVGDKHERSNYRQRTTLPLHERREKGFQSYWTSLGWVQGSEVVEAHGASREGSCRTSKDSIPLRTTERVHNIEDRRRARSKQKSSMPWASKVRGGGVGRGGGGSGGGRGGGVREDVWVD